MTQGQVIAVDGKTLRRSHDRNSGKEAIHMVSAWASENSLVLGQTKVEAKSNEITAIPELLNLLDMSGCIATIDTMGCQKKIARQIVSQEADVQRQLLLPVPSIILAGSPPVSDCAAGPLRCGSWGRRIPG